MKEPIKFPVSQRDLDKGRLARSAKMLSTMATTPMPIAVANKVLANLLGYSDLDEIERSANCLSLRKFRTTWKSIFYMYVIYRAHTLYNIPINRCDEFVDRLGLMDYYIMKRDYSFVDRYDRLNSETRPGSGHHATRFQKLSNKKVKRATFGRELLHRTKTRRTN